MEAADFSGYATKAGLRCSDGRTITPEAFKHMNGLQVPLVWQHGHDKPENVLGHVFLESVNDGVRAHGFFNDTPAGQNAKLLVQHKDITKLSIYANQLVEKAKRVLHGMIKEVSLVIGGANPGAHIDQVRVQHSDDVNDFTELEDEAVIHTGLAFDFVVEELDEDDLEHADEETVQDVYDSLDEKQKAVVNFMLAEAVNASNSGAAHSDGEGDKKEGDLKHEEGTTEVTKNIFENNGKGAPAAEPERHYISHDDMKSIFATAQKPGMTMKAAVEEYALAHNIDNIGLLFPDAKMIGDRPEFVKRRTEWVTRVLNATSKTGFSRIKTMLADITLDEARARGYVKGNFKKEEFFAVTKRTTAPTTIYKKQKLDRDDILDITDFDVVAWLKFEMRLMLEEEAARAILIGDGRDVSDEDKVKDPVGAQDGIGIRSILNDHELYTTTIYVNIADASSSQLEIVEAILLNRRFLKGSGTPDYYTTEENLALMLLAKDLQGRRYWNSVAELALAMRVGEIITVEPMESLGDVHGILVNLTDYNVGTDKGGEISYFTDFDIDYNQQKYLMETRFSGALVKYKAAMVVKTVVSGAALVDPITSPTFVAATGVVTIPTQTGVTYKNFDTNATLSAGAQAALAEGETLNVIAVPTSASYYFASNAEDQWSFTRPVA